MIDRYFVDGLVNLTGPLDLFDRRFASPACKPASCVNM